MKLKKICSSVLAAVFVLSAVCGCTGKKDGEISTDANGNYVPKEELKLTVWETMGSDYSPASGVKNNIVADWLKDKTKVEVENIFGNGGGQWDSKLSMLVAGDNLPQIVHCGGYQGPAHFAKLAEIDKVWELTPELLEKYAPNLLKRVPQPMWDRMKVDGKIYGIPYGLATNKTTQPLMTQDEIDYTKAYMENVKSDTQNVLWIRDDIVKKLYPAAKSWEEICSLIKEKQQPVGEELFDIPVDTTEQYLKLLYDIKAMNLKNGSKSVYPFGYTGGDNWVAFSFLGADMMGYALHCYTSSWNDVTREIRLPLVEPLLREGARLHNQMIRDKVIDPESLVQTSNMFKEKVFAGEYIIFPIEQVGMNWADFNEQLKKDGKPFQYRPLYTKVPAKEGYAPFKQPTLWTNSIALLKTMSKQQLIQTLNWINVMCSDEFEEVGIWGPKSANLYTEDENGNRKYNDERFNERFIKGNAKAIDTAECMGLGGSDASQFYVTVCSQSMTRWNPRIKNKLIDLKPGNAKTLGFSLDSKHITDVKMFPPCQAWSPEYAEIPELVKYWSERGQWEQPFRVALAADTEENFNKKWDEALSNLNNTVDIKKMCEKMTEIARAEDDKIKADNITDGY